jgi:hypothetical protein
MLRRILRFLEGRRAGFVDVQQLTWAHTIGCWGTKP